KEPRAVDLPRVHRPLAAQLIPQGAPAAQRRPDGDAAREPEIERLRTVPPAGDPLDQPGEPGGPIPVDVPGHRPTNAFLPDPGHHGAPRHRPNRPAQAPSTGI